MPAEPTGPPVYLDHAAGSPVRREAVAAMVPFLAERFGNPSGGHQVARRARAALEEARESVAADLGCRPGEVVFTGSGTEAANLAVLGRHAVRPGSVVCSAVEHHAVLGPARHLGAVLAPVDTGGRVDLDGLASVLGPDVTLVSVMLANNETGVVQPLDAVAALVRERAPAAALHTDAVAAVPWVDVAAHTAVADLVSVSAHKFGGPQGVGMLIVRDGAELGPVTFGGGQERDRRSGSHNLAGVVGAAAALRATTGDRAATAARVAARRDRLAEGVLAAVDGARETIPGRAGTVAGIWHVRFPGVEQEELLYLLDEAGVCASGGAACASGALEPSHVLRAMGVDAADARGALRLSLGPGTTEADVDAALDALPAALSRLRR